MLASAFPAAAFPAAEPLTTASIPVELWAPALQITDLMEGLTAARLDAVLVPEHQISSGTCPLLVVYPDPVALLDCLSLGQAGSTDLSEQAFPQWDALARLHGASRPWRLVNSGCHSVPALVGWCVDPHGTAARLESSPGFAPADPLAAWLAGDLLRQHPAWLQAYQQLERHPQAACLDGRPADDGCLQRLAEGGTWAGVLRAWRSRRQLEAELTDLSEAAESLEHLQLETAELRLLRDQWISRDCEREALLAELQGVRAVADQEQKALHQRCAELRDTVAASHRDLRVLVQRLDGLETLVRQAASASVTMQTLMSRMLR